MDLEAWILPKTSTRQPLRYLEQNRIDISRRLRKTAGGMLSTILRDRLRTGALKERAELKGWVAQVTSIMRDYHAFKLAAIRYWERRRVIYNLALLLPAWFGYRFADTLNWVGGSQDSLRIRSSVVCGVRARCEHLLLVCLCTGVSVCQRRPGVALDALWSHHSICWRSFVRDVTRAHWRAKYCRDGVAPWNRTWWLG